jgi:hypothetical protein
VNEVKTLGETGWKFHEEFIRLNPHLLDVGIGNDAQEQCGVSPAELAKLLQSLLLEFTDGGANVILFHPSGQAKDATRLYVRRRGRHIDAGTRKDFELLKWGSVCDALDNAKSS